MGNEFYHSADEAEVYYALVFRKSDNKVWNETDDTFDTYTDADILKYDIPLSVVVDSDYHIADFPVAITDSALQTYRVQIFLQSGGSPSADDDLAESQGEIYWDGTSESDLGTITITNNTITNVYNEDVDIPPVQVFNL